MSANFLSLVNGIKTLLQAATVSDGTSRIIASNSNGLIDSSFLPVVNSSGNLFFETLTVSAQNTLSNLTHTPTNSTLIKLYVNGKAEFIPSFSISVILDIIS